MNIISSIEKTSSVSVVIATLGGEQLFETIEVLNQGTIIPCEILVCLPEEDALLVKRLSFPNVRVINAARRGQVAQRAIGFQKASGRFVLQLDDDILVSNDCLECLLNVITLDAAKVAVAPSLLFKSSRKSFYQTPKNKTLLQLYYWLINGVRGYQPGSITMAGTNVGVDPQFVEYDTVEVEWVPGGCLLHHRDCLIVDDFYPFTGKAYSEDLYHSYFLRKNKVKLMVCTSAECFLDDTMVVYNFSVPEFISYVQADLKARIHLVRISKKSVIRMYVYYAFVILRYASARFKKILGHR